MASGGIAAPDVEVVVPQAAMPVVFDRRSMTDQPRNRHGDLAVRRLSKRFPGQLALDQVDLTVHPGEVHAVLGHNGSGKSTLIKILAGYHVPDPGGRVSVGSDELSFGAPQDSLRLGLRFVHQTLGLVERFNAVENIGLGGYTSRWDRSIDWAAQATKAERLLARLGVSLDIWRPMDECQAVERTAVAIARALDDHGGLIRFLILDEPTAALPPTEVDRLFAVIGEVVTMDIGVVYVSHRLDEIERLADRVTVLRDGRHVGTFDADQLDRAALVSLIVGPNAVMNADRIADKPAAPQRMAPLLEVRGLAGGALRGVSLIVGPGEIVGVAGLVGSGRDQFAKALSGNLRDVLVSSLKLSGYLLTGTLRAHELRKAGLVLAPGTRERGSAVSSFRARENVTLPVLSRYRRSGRIVRRLERDEVAELAQQLDIRPKDPERLFGLFSGGNQQKIVIAAALNQLPKVVVLDEPTAGVDVSAREAIFALVRRYADAKVGFVVASSDLEDFVGLAHRVVVLVNGRVADVLDGGHMNKDALLAATLGFGQQVTKGTRPEGITA